MFSLICVWINSWVNNREAGDLRRYRAHYDVTVMSFAPLSVEERWVHPFSSGPVLLFRPTKSQESERFVVVCISIKFYPYPPGLLPWCLAIIRLPQCRWSMLGKHQKIPRRTIMQITAYHDDVMTWKRFPRCWSFVRGIHRSPVVSPHSNEGFDVVFDVSLNTSQDKQSCHR